VEKIPWKVHTETFLLTKRTFARRSGSSPDRRIPMSTDLAKAIAELETEVKKKQADLMALRRAREILDLKSVPIPRSVKGGKPKIKPKSGIRLAEKALEAAGGPLHVDDIIKQIASAGTKKRFDKPSLASSLQRYSRLEKIFKKTAPNTFDLLKRRQPAIPGS
jgi:hypothetical protein